MGIAKGTSEASRAGRVGKAAGIAGLGLLLVVLPQATVAASGRDASREAPRAVSQRGVIELAGCRVDAGDIALTATPFYVEGAKPGRPADPPEGPTGEHLPVHKAIVTPTADPHVFTYVLHGLKATLLHTVDVAVTPGLCPQTTWVGPKRGLFAPGEKPSLDIHGYALTTRIDVVGSDGNGGTVYRGADALTLESDRRQFRIRTDLPGVTDFLLEVATEVFRPDAENPDTCGTPRGLLFRQRLHAAAGDTLTPPIDFWSITQNEFSLPGTPEGFADPDFYLAVSETAKDAVLKGAPVYVRAIPLRADGSRLCDPLRDGVAAHSIAAYLGALATGLRQSDSLLVTGTYRPAQPPTGFDSCLMAVKPHATPAGPLDGDPFGYAFRVAGAVDDQGVVQPGMYICGNRSTSIIDDVGDFVSGFIDGIASIVNYIAKLYEDIKAGIVSAVGDVLSALQLPCGEGSWCREALNAALTTALASMGLPPSLPDFDALVDQGLDYVKGYVVAQAGIPPAVVAAADVAVPMIMDAAKNASQGGGPADWFVPDNMFRPAVLTLDVTRNILSTKEQSTGLRIETSPDLIFPRTDVPVPRNIMSARIPVVLRPDISGLPVPCVPMPIGPPVCFGGDIGLKAQLNAWYGFRFINRCAGVTISQFVGSFTGFGSASSPVTHSIFTTLPASFDDLPSNVCPF